MKQRQKAIFHMAKDNRINPVLQEHIELIYNLFSVIITDDSHKWFIIKISTTFTWGLKNTIFVFKQ